MLLDVFFYLRGVGGWDSRHSSTVLPHLKISLDCSPFTVCCFAFEKTWLPCGCDEFLYCSSRQQLTKLENDCFWLCLCLDHVEDARRFGFSMGGCSARGEDVFFFVPCQTKAGRSRLFETPLDLIVSFAVMSESFCWHTQCLIQRRYSECFLIVLLSRQILLYIWPHVLLTVSLQLLMLSRFGRSAAFDNDRLIVQQSETCSLNQEGILMCEQLFDQTLGAVQNCVSKCGERRLACTSG